MMVALTVPIVSCAVVCCRRVSRFSYIVRSDAAQRSIAARGLGQLGVRAAVPELLRVLPKDVSEAAEALDFGYQCATLWIDALDHRKD